MRGLQPVMISRSAFGRHRVLTVLTGIAAVMLTLSVLWRRIGDPGGYYDPGRGFRGNAYIEFRSGSVVLVTPETDGNPRSVSPFGSYWKTNGTWYWRGNGTDYELEAGVFGISTKHAGVPTGENLPRTHPSLLRLKSGLVELEAKLWRLAIEY